jgi:hypothetical protein
VFGAYALSDGVLALIMALSVRGVAGFGSLLVCHVRSGQSYPSPARSLMTPIDPEPVPLTVTSSRSRCHAVPDRRRPDTREKRARIVLNEMFFCRRDLGMHVWKRPPRCRRLEQIFASVQRFCAAQPLTDDCTAVELTYVGNRK